MHKCAFWLALVALLVTAALTTSINVRATFRSYTLGRYVRTCDDLRMEIAHRQAKCRKLLRTGELAAAVERLGLQESDLFPTIPTVGIHPGLVMSSP